MGNAIVGRNANWMQKISGANYYESNIGALRRGSEIHLLCKFSHPGKDSFFPGKSRLDKGLDSRDKRFAIKLSRGCAKLAHRANAVKKDLKIHD
jgi:hypothetical protein